LRCEPPAVSQVTIRIPHRSHGLPRGRLLSRKSACGSRNSGLVCGCQPSCGVLIQASPINSKASLGHLPHAAYAPVRRIEGVDSWRRSCALGIGATAGVEPATAYTNQRRTRTLCSGRRPGFKAVGFAASASRLGYVCFLGPGARHLAPRYRPVNHRFQKVFGFEVAILDARAKASTVHRGSRTIRNRGGSDEIAVPVASETQSDTRPHREVRKLSRNLSVASFVGNASSWSA